MLYPNHRFMTVPPLHDRILSPAYGSKAFPRYQYTVKTAGRKANGKKKRKKGKEKGGRKGKGKGKEKDTRGNYIHSGPCSGLPFDLIISALVFTKNFSTASVGLVP